MKYQIETRNKYDSNWSSYIGSDNFFSTKKKANDAIDELKKLGEDWAESEYRVQEMNPVGQELARVFG